MNLIPPLWYPGINFGHRQARGLIRAFPLNETTGSIANDLASNNHGTVTGTTTSAVREGRVRYFDGGGGPDTSADNVNIGPLPEITNVGQKLTMSAWIWFESIQVNQIMISQGTSGGSNVTTIFGWTDGRLLWQVYGSANRVDVSGAYAAGETMHLCGTYDQNTLRLYKNGIEIGTGNRGVAWINNYDDFYLGWADWPVGDASLAGSLWDARIYDRALSPAEVWDIANQGHELYLPA